MPVPQMLEITPPRELPRGISLSASFLRAVHTLSGPVSLEIVQEPQHVTLQLAAHTEAMALILAQARRLFASADFKLTPLGADPAQPRPHEAMAVCELRLATSTYLPIQCFEDDVAGVPDPLCGLCSLTDALSEGERAVAQVLVEQAPYWPPPDTLRPRPPEPQPNPPALALWIGGFVVFGLSLGILASRPDIFGLGCVMLMVLGLCAGLYWYTVNSPFPFQLDRVLVEEKAHDVGFRATIRLLAFSPSAERAPILLKTLAAGYGQFNRGRGNHFKVHWPKQLDLSRAACRGPLWEPPQILTASEIAGLWHLPLRAADVPYLESVAYRPTYPPHGV